MDRSREGLPHALSQCLRQQSGLDRRSQAHGVPRRRQADADGGRTGVGRREGGGGDRRFRVARHVRQLLHRPRGCQGGDADRRAAIAANLSLTRALHAVVPATNTGMTVKGSCRTMTDIALNKANPIPGEPSVWKRLKVNRHWLSIWFMLPAAAFLILFL